VLCVWGSWVIAEDERLFYPQRFYALVFTRSYKRTLCGFIHRVF
jgi:hypothetical protein